MFRCAAIWPLVAASLVLSDDAAADALTPRVQANYMLHCMGCHLADGSGATG